MEGMSRSRTNKCCALGILLHRKTSSGRHTAPAPGPLVIKLRRLQPLGTVRSFGTVRHPRYRTCLCTVVFLPVSLVRCLSICPESWYCAVLGCALQSKTGTYLWKNNNFHKIVMEFLSKCLKRKGVHFCIKLKSYVKFNF